MIKNQAKKQHELSLRHALGLCLISVFIFLSHFIIADSFIKYRHE